MPRTAALLLLACASCTAPVNLKTAHAMDKGQAEALLAAGLAVWNPSANRDLPFGPVLPTFDAAIRVGVLNGVDVGGRLGLSHAEVNSTITLIRMKRFELALSPAVGGWVELERLNGRDFPLPYPRGYVRLDLLTGVNFGPHQLVLSPDVMMIFPDGHTPLKRTALLVGGGIGFAYRVNANLAVMPTLSFHTRFPSVAPLDRVFAPSQAGEPDVQLSVVFSRML